MVPLIILLFVAVVLLLAFHLAVVASNTVVRAIALTVVVAIASVTLPTISLLAILLAVSPLLVLLVLLVLPIVLDNTTSTIVIPPLLPRPLRREEEFWCWC